MKKWLAVGLILVTASIAAAQGPFSAQIQRALASAAVTSGVASGYKVARGTITLDGSNPSSAATGLTTIVSCTVNGPTAAAIPTDDPMGATPRINGTSLDIYAWKTDGTDPTPVASTNNSAVFYWICIGT